MGWLLINVTPVAGVMFSKFKTYIKNGHQGDLQDHKGYPKKYVRKNLGYILRR